MNERQLKIERIWGKLEGVAIFMNLLREKKLQTIEISETCLEAHELITKEFTNVEKL